MRKYAYGIKDGEPDYAPYTVKIGRVTRVTDGLSVEEARSLNLLPVVTDNQPTATGVTYSPSGWALNEQGTAVERVWEATPIVAPVKAYSTDEVVYGLVNADVYDTVANLVGNGLMALFLKRDTIPADNEIWQSKWPELKAAIIAQGILSEESIDAILKDAEV